MACQGATSKRQLLGVAIVYGFQAGDEEGPERGLDDVVANPDVRAVEQPPPFRLGVSAGGGIGAAGDLECGLDRAQQGAGQKIGLVVAEAPRYQLQDVPSAAAALPSP